MNTEKLTTPIGDFEFVLDGYPTKETAQKLFDALDFQRACRLTLTHAGNVDVFIAPGPGEGLGCREIFWHRLLPPISIRTTRFDRHRKYLLPVMSTFRRRWPNSGSHRFGHGQRYLFTVHRRLWHRFTGSARGRVPAAASGMKAEDPRRLFIRSFARLYEFRFMARAHKDGAWARPSMGMAK